jgi:hypothetical protein
MKKLLPQNYRIKRMFRGDTVKDRLSSDSEINSIDAIDLYFQLTINLPRSKSRVRIPCPALPFNNLRLPHFDLYPINGTQLRSRH